MLKREGRDASTQTAFEPRDSAPESERVGSKNKAVATPGELVTESEDVGPSDEAAVEPKKGFTRKADMFTEFARRAKERAGEKKGGK